MDDYRRELTEVQRELREISSQVEALLERQSSLQEKKQILESIIRQHEAEQAAADSEVRWDATNFSWSGGLQGKQQEVFGLKTLRPMQLQTMNATLAGKDCLLIMPTGGGKSLCFQLPAVISKGVTLVVSPLVSLMEDQLMGLEGTSVSAALLCATSDKAEVKRITDGLTDIKSQLQLLYVTPEKLAKSKRFMTKLQKMYEMGRFARLVIDEVHCCSQWGHDFRPDYKFLGIMKRQFPSVPILGLTATATMKVLGDVKKILSIPQCLVFKASFNRANLYYEVHPKPSSLKDTMDTISQLIKSKFNGQSGIVYCFSRKDTEDVARELQGRGIRAGCYHANLSAQQRKQVHRQWTADKIQVVVATVAFGMGIDKPDVRFVIHHSLSKSMENLYQEAGRAGRDDKRASCIVYYRLADVFRQSTMVFTEQTGVDNLYGIVTYCTDVSRCRRSMIARHFGEVWDSTQCNGMCDHCDPERKKETNRRDVTRLCTEVLRIVEQATASQQRITGQKLVDAWFHRGSSRLHIKSVPVPGISTERAERIVATLLLQGYLREDYHFTPYNTISYIVLGTKANQLLQGAGTISMEFEGKQSAQGSKKSSVSSSSASSSSLSSSQPTQPSPGTSRSEGSKNHSSSASKNWLTRTQSESSKSKPKLVVINRENSVFTDAASVPVGGGDKCESGAAKAAVHKNKKRVIADSSDGSGDDSGDDSDLEGLDFDEMPSINLSKRRKTDVASSASSSVKAVNGRTSQSEEAICIASSGDSDFE